MESILAQIAKNHNTTTEEVRAEMESAIASAKGNENFRAMFGDRIPSIEEFISAMVLLLQEPETPLQ